MSSSKKLGNEPLIKSYSISQMYSLYAAKKLIVNRQYQRKLCWTIEEKRNFIDTVMNNLPVPMFLFAENAGGELEVIDGMQRLDAICSLIEQKYSLKSGFFNLETMPDTINLMRQGHLKQKGGTISADICRNIANYPLPVSIFSYEDSSQIEEAFKRINSTGRHLSLQELRQVGVNSKFSELVRTLSSQARGDVSKDILKLNEMSNISLSNHRLQYGIYTGKVFWVSNEIIDAGLLRGSRDEEIVAFIIANMILNDGERAAYTSETLNKYYGYDPNPLSTRAPLEMTTIENAVDRVTRSIIEKKFNTVFSVIKEVLTQNRISFKNCIYNKSPESRSIKDLAFPFQSVFMAIHNLIFKENLSSVNYDLFYRNLQGIGNELFTAESLSELRLVAKMNTKISFVMGKIRPAFSKSSVEDPAVDDWTMQCTNIIMKSRTEQNLYDFKIGLVTFGENKINKNGINKIIKTLTAINNLGPNKVGYVIVGIADNERAAIEFEKQYSTSYQSVDNSFIVGIDAEAKSVNQSIDRYTHSIKEYIKTHNSITEEYRTHILQNMFTPLFYGKQLIVFKTNYSEPVMYDNKLHERLFSDVNEVSPSQYTSIYKRFFRS
ncbi:DUF262 domain-containing protein [Paenibacillus sp. NPDC056933]|uniref:DUF262 domain-containing protein n=1 Tax=Paenibacillus sp. NPDC056933 TaxID=3345968 RepID=UPI003637605D